MSKGNLISSWCWYIPPWVSVSTGMHGNPPCNTETSPYLLAAWTPPPGRGRHPWKAGRNASKKERKEKEKETTKQPSRLNHTTTIILTQPQPSQPSTPIHYNAYCPLCSQQILLDGKGRALGTGDASLICTTQFISKFDLKGRSDKPLVLASTLAVFLVTPLGGNPRCNTQIRELSNLKTSFIVYCTVHSTSKEPSLNTNPPSTAFLTAPGTPPTHPRLLSTKTQCCLYTDPTAGILSL